MSEELKAAVLAGLYDQDKYLVDESYGPKMIVNQNKETVWEYLQQELLSCTSFVLAPAFITTDMLVPLKAICVQLAKKGVTGTIVTSDYLGFNSPEMFKELLKLPNVKTQIVAQGAFHAKGYFFWHDGYQTAYIGSSNFTRNALLKNCEFNLRLSSADNAAFTQQIQQILTQIMHQAQPLEPAWITDYEKNYLAPNAATRLAPTTHEIKPNQMQQVALKELHELRKNKTTKGLIVSATGTGKTYLGAFDVKAYRPKRFLYLVHRRQILEKAKQSFQKVLGPGSYGIYSGQSRDDNAKYLFATIQTMAKDEVLAQFAKDEFDYILFDEAHHIGAKSYQKIMAHFEPKFCLGMTATPERMDDFNVYQAFDYNLAYEINLSDALQAGMLCPFDYVGVTDYEYEGQMIDEKAPLQALVAPKRVAHILKQLAYYGGKSSGGLVFCSRQAEAKELAKSFTKAGYPSLALTNETSITQRKKAVAALEKGEIKYLISVDIFNEGIDIPCVDQIILLRNTQSSIVFTQQLGRGLRLYPHKKSTLILDFIGNYKNNYLIPQVLTADRSLNKDRLLTDLKQQVVYELSTINFEEIAYERILAGIQKTKLDALKHLREAYQELKQKLGRMPKLLDFMRFSQIDPLIFTQNSQLASYADFVEKVERKKLFTSYEHQVISFLEKELLNGMRRHELLLLQQLVKHGSISREKYCELLLENDCYVDQAVLTSMENILTLSFFAVKAGKKLRSEAYGKQPLILVGDDYQLAPQLADCLSAPDFKAYVTDILETGLLLAQNYAPTKRFTLYQKYTRKDVCRLLDFDKDISAPLYGYRVVGEVCPIFITYQKASTRHGYQNVLTDNTAIRWYTRSPRTLASQEVKALLAKNSAGQAQVSLPLFIKPSDAFGAEFYYVGQAKIAPDSVKEEQLAAGKKVKKVVGMDLIFEQPLPLNLLEKLKPLREDPEY